MKNYDDITFHDDAGDDVDGRNDGDGDDDDDDSHSTKIVVRTIITTTIAQKYTTYISSQNTGSHSHVGVCVGRSHMFRFQL